LTFASDRHSSSQSLQLDQDGWLGDWSDEVVSGVRDALRGTRIPNDRKACFFGGIELAHCISQMLWSIEGSSKHGGIGGIGQSTAN
jgi:hypothetical protein